jgi:uncharacterized SAM-binding protein YcdF (DUF218 family)
VAAQSRLTVFFVLSKLFAFFTQPSNVIVVLGLVGLVLTRTRFARAGWRVAGVSVFLIAAMGFLPIGTALMIPLENRFPPWDPSGAAPAGIVVLGGAISAHKLATRGEVGINEAAERIIALPSLAKRYPQARIIYSGGDAGLFVRHGSEAGVVTELFESLGISASRLTLEDRSRNTAENAIYSKTRAKPKPGERWLVVTSALHMPRAIGAFREAGFDVEAYPVDYQTNGWGDLLDSFGSASWGLTRVDNALHEWIGLLAYRLTGKTSALLPGPVGEARP